MRGHTSKKNKANQLSCSEVRAHLHRLEPLPRRRLLALGLVTVRGRVRVRARVSRPAQPRFRVTTAGLRRRLCDLACAPLLQPRSLGAQVGELGAPVLDLPPHRFLLLLRLSKGRGLAAGRAGRVHGGSHAGTPRFVQRRQARRCARHRTPTRRCGGGGTRKLLGTSTESHLSRTWSQHCRSSARRPLAARGAGRPCDSCGRPRAGTPPRPRRPRAKARCPWAQTRRPRTCR